VRWFLLVNKSVSGCIRDWKDVFGMPAFSKLDKPENSMRINEKGMNQAIILSCTGDFSFV
jgi:hypothetical protein